MARVRLNLRRSVASVYRTVAFRLKSVFSILIIPLIWAGTVVATLVRTIQFCLAAPIHNYLKPFKSQAQYARSYEEWRDTQVKLDKSLKVHLWSHQDQDASYDWRGLQKFKEDLEVTRRSNDTTALYGHLRAQATRNCASVLASRLYRKSQIQTKRLIHNYVHEVRLCIDKLTKPECNTRPDSSSITEEKRRLLSDVRQILGRTTLVLQGGAMLSMCHLGVVRALHRRRLLPKIITATGTGSLVAAIVGCTPDDQLLSALEGASININAFILAREQRTHADAGSFPIASWTRAITRRTRRLFHTGHIFEIDVLTQCVRDNIGDVTFEEAYANSGRILNITIAKPDVEGTPQLLNYITAPHVVVWSAVAASIATSKRMFAAAPLKCKDDVGIIGQYHAVDSPSPSTGTRSNVSNSRIPMERIGELFDVNHYIVSQTRPYIIPLVRLKEFMCQDPLLGAIVKVVYCEVLHRLNTLNQLGLVPTSIQRIFIDEDIPSTSSWSKFVITPELSPLDYLNIFNFPSPKVIDNWAMKGERSVWPKICQLKIRCCVEFEIEAAYCRDTTKVPAHAILPRAPAVNGHA